MRVDDLAAAVGDGGEAFVGQDRQGDNGQEPVDGRGGSAAGAAVGEVGATGIPQAHDREDGETGDLDRGHDPLGGLSQPVAGHVDDERQCQQAHPERGHPVPSPYCSLRNIATPLDDGKAFESFTYE